MVSLLSELSLQLSNLSLHSCLSVVLYATSLFSTLPRFFFRAAIIDLLNELLPHAEVINGALSHVITLLEHVEVATIEMCLQDEIRVLLNLLHNFSLICYELSKLVLKSVATL